MILIKACDRTLNSTTPSLPQHFRCSASGFHVLIVMVFIVHICGCSSPPPDIDTANARDLFSDPLVVRLVLAAETGDTETINDSIKHGVNVNSKGRYSVTPLLRSLLAKNKEGYSCLLGHGADPNTLNIRGLAVVNKAALESETFWLELALKYGGNPNLLNTGNSFCPGETPIFYAISKSRLENVKLLIAAGANLNHKDATQDFPLLQAARRPAYDIVYTLLQAGADFRQKDSAGDDLPEWISRRNEKSFSGRHREQGPWFSKTVEFLKKSGAVFELRKD